MSVNTMNMTVCVSAGDALNVNEIHLKHNLERTKLQFALCTLSVVDAAVYLVATVAALHFMCFQILYLTICFALVQSMMTRGNGSGQSVLVVTLTHFVVADNKLTAIVTFTTIDDKR